MYCRGTVLVKDIRAGSAGSDPRYLTNVNGTLYFRANDGANGVELWKSDGNFRGNCAGQGYQQLCIQCQPVVSHECRGTLYFRAADAGGPSCGRATVRVRERFE